MKVKDLIKQLFDYNLDADISVVAHCREEDFSSDLLIFFIAYGDSEGVTKENCDTVSLYVDRLCTNEKSNEVDCEHDFNG